MSSGNVDKKHHWRPSSSTMSLFVENLAATSLLFVALALLLFVAEVQGNSCPLCDNKVHLKETRHEHQGVPFTMDNREYEVKEAVVGHNPKMNPVTLQNHIVAYAATHFRPPTGSSHEMLAEIVYNKYKELKGHDGNPVYTMALGLANVPTHGLKSCCRGLIQKLKTSGDDDEPDVTKTLCGHTKCTAWPSGEHCNPWTPIPHLQHNEFHPCTQMYWLKATTPESPEGPSQAVMVPPKKLVMVKTTMAAEKRRTFERMKQRRKFTNSLPCIECQLEIEEMRCKICHDVHLPTVNMMRSDNDQHEVIAGDRIYTIGDVKITSHFNEHTGPNNIVAYANGRIKREDGEIWVIEEQQQYWDDSGAFYGVTAILERDENEPKICCRTVARKMPADSLPKCGHTMCTHFHSKEECFSWNVNHLGEEEFHTCLQMAEKNHPGHSNVHHHTNGN